ncbi:MAG: ATP-binding cassette domain-containing protein, partial [Clostridia bacterium]|nr:ATP-binding cassette domain-containing protein [Clostridia bacterium]
GQRMQLWWDVPILDSYRLLKDIYKIDKNDFENRLEELTDALDLKELLATPLRLMSLGQRMRAELCGSLLHSPKLLFLDEPTIGLDAVSKLKLREFLQKENKEKGTTILLTTHDMEDIAALCSRVMVLGHGKKLFDGPLPELLSRYDTQRTIHVRYDAAPDFSSLPESCTLQKEGDNYIITYTPAELPTAEIIARLQQAGRMQEMTAQSQNIDHLIARMYREMDL